MEHDPKADLPSSQNKMDSENSEYDSPDLESQSDAKPGVSIFPIDFH